VIALGRIGVVAHPERAGAQQLGDTLGRWAGANGLTVRTLDSEKGCAGPDAETTGEAAFPVGLDLIVALGGDGTLLRAAGLGLEHEVPVLGVNLGRLGFLTEVEAHDLTAALDLVLAGQYTVERRMTLDAAVVTADGARVELPSAVNDVVLEKTAKHRLAGVAVSIDGRLFARYAADGLIVATPTGSTAYSFSAGGPIVTPTIDAVMLTPIAPHMVFNRSLVLDPGQVVSLEVLADSLGVEVSVDGRPSRHVPPGCAVHVRRGRHDARLVRLHGADFFGRVRSKFRLPDAADVADAAEPGGPSAPG
jgi:NAD+ kinase